MYDYRREDPHGADPPQGDRQVITTILDSHVQDLPLCRCCVPLMLSRLVRPIGQ